MNVIHVRTYYDVYVIFSIVLIEFPHFGNAVYGILMTGSNDDRFCFELGKSKFLYWILSFLNVGVMIDLLQVHKITYNT